MIALGASATLGAAAEPASESAQPEKAATYSEEFVAFIDGLAGGQMQIHQTPGMLVAYHDKKRGPLLRAYGVSDFEDARPLSARDTQFPIASISKVFVAVALLRAQDMGLLNLDDAANQHLDFELPTFPESRAITLRDLARHEAGFEERWLATGAGPTPDPRPWGEILAMTYPQLIAPPGAYASYSNYGVALLGYIVERAAGVPFHQFVAEQITAPLGMEHSMFEGFGELEEDRVAKGSTVSNGFSRGAQESYNKRTYPAGRLISTLGDMSRFMHMLLNGGVGSQGQRILSSEAVNELFEAKRVHPRVPGIGVVVAEKDIAGHRFIGHGGDGGTHHTDMILDPQRGIGVFVAFLSAPGPQARDYFTRGLVARLYEGQLDAPLPLPSADSGYDLTPLAGNYRMYRWAFTSIERALQLISEFSILDSRRGTLIVKGRLGPGEYVPAEEEHLFRNRLTGELLYFWTSWDGKQNVTLGSFPFVTAFKLAWIDTQGANALAFSAFTKWLGALSLLLLILAVAALRRGSRSAATAHVLLGASGLLASGALLAAIVIGSSISEPMLQKQMPSQADWVLALPLAALAILIVYLLGVVRGFARPGDKLQWLLHGVGLALLFAYFAYLHHWHALGWNYP
jgi:CubicO group peptidase (beta-lactamase class C family)